MSYQLPKNIVDLIGEELSSLPIESSRHATKTTTELYETQNGTQLRSLSTDEQLSYMATRMPATFAANSRVFELLCQEISELSPTSILDLGAGSGSATLATLLSFPTIRKVTIVEREKHFLKFAERFIKDSFSNVSLALKATDIIQAKLPDPADLVLVSYALNELPADSFAEFIDSAWRATSSLIVFIEPGTIKGYGNILKVRDQLISLGANLVAPCPHTQLCPLIRDSWCHFRVRFNRSKIHKSVKDASLNYEEEPFSFIAFSKNKLTLPIGDRIIGFPRKEKGFMTFDLCNQNGERVHRRLMKRNKEIYKRASKLTWGDKLG